MKIVRVVAVCREDGHSNRNFKLVLLCGINETHQIEDGEWMGYTQNESVFNPFILRGGNSCFYGGEKHYLEPTNIGRGSIGVGRFFTVSSPAGEIGDWESTYEIVSCHVY